MNKKLKVGIGTDAFPPTTDGISNVAQNYAAEINKRLGEAVVITPKNPNQLDYKYNYEIFRYKSWWVPSKEGYSIGWPFKESLSYDIINRNFDLLHSHAPLATSYYFRLVNRKKRIPTVLTYHTKYEYDIDEMCKKAKNDYERLNEKPDELLIRLYNSRKELKKHKCAGEREYNDNKKRRNQWITIL